MKQNKLSFFCLMLLTLQWRMELVLVLRMLQKSVNIRVLSSFIDILLRFYMKKCPLKVELLQSMMYTLLHGV